MITQEELKYYLDYNPDTGVFVWAISPNNSVKVEDIAGYLNGDYICIQFKRKMYKAHRLAWLFTYGYCPEYEVDHRDGIGTHNWISNLREATHTCNMQNKCLDSRNVSGFPGVSYYAKTDQWRAKIQLHGKVIPLGYYACSLEAALTRLTAEIWDDRWSCDHRSELSKAIKKAWPEFNERCL